MLEYVGITVLTAFGSRTVLGKPGIRQVYTGFDPFTDVLIDTSTGRDAGVVRVFDQPVLIGVTGPERVFRLLRASVYPDAVLLFVAGFKKFVLPVMPFFLAVFVIVVNVFLRPAVKCLVVQILLSIEYRNCLLYTSDAADDR